MGWFRRLGSVAAILAAAAVAYVAYASGEAGPMAMFGRGDANIAAANAWVQIPAHAAIALGFAAAAPVGLRLMGWVGSYFATVVLSLWATLMLLGGVAYLGDYTDPLDVLVSALLLTLYAAAFALSRRSIASPLRDLGGSP